MPSCCLMALAPRITLLFPSQNEDSRYSDPGVTPSLLLSRTEELSLCSGLVVPRPMLVSSGQGDELLCSYTCFLQSLIFQPHPHNDSTRPSLGMSNLSVWKKKAKCGVGGQTWGTLGSPIYHSPFWLLPPPLKALGLSLRVLCHPYFTQTLAMQSQWEMYNRARSFSFPSKAPMGP